MAMESKKMAHKETMGGIRGETNSDYRRPFSNVSSATWGQKGSLRFGNDSQPTNPRLVNAAETKCTFQIATSLR